MVGEATQKRRISDTRMVHTDIESLTDSAKLTMLVEHVDLLFNAFPDRDVSTHCEFHAAKIKAAVAEEEFWRELKIDIAKKGMWSLLILLLGLLVLGLSAKFGLGLPK